MIGNDSILLDLKRDLCERLLSDAFLAEVPVLALDEHDLDERAELILRGNLKREPAGRTGAVIIVHAVDFVGVTAVNTPMPVGTVAVTIECSEHVLANQRGQGGTGIDAAALVARVTQLLHHLHLGTVGGTWRLRERDAIRELVLEPGQRGYEVIFELSNVAFAIVPTLGPVTIAATAGTVTLSCADAEDVIRYTVDGSYPGKENPASRVYVEPFDVTAGETWTVRAVAEKAGWNASGVVARAVVTGPAE